MSGIDIPSPFTYSVITSGASDLIPLKDLQCSVKTDSLTVIASFISKLPLELPEGEYYLEVKQNELHVYRLDGNIDEFYFTDPSKGGRSRQRDGCTEITFLHEDISKILLHTEKQPRPDPSSTMPLLSEDGLKVSSELEMLTKCLEKLNDDPDNPELLKQISKLLQRVEQAYSAPPPPAVKKKAKAKAEDPDTPPTPPRKPKVSNTTSYSGYSSGGG
jgi:hypothetical protein